MATATFPPTASPAVSVEEYLRTSYQPDCDYVDGEIKERNVGEYEHGKIQSKLDRLLGNREAEWGIDVIVECRLQVAADHFRVPDVMVLRRGTKVSRIVLEAPLVCIEVLSPEDTWTKMFARLNDYLGMGVEHIWCFDPESREAWSYTAGGLRVVREAELTVPGTAIRVAIAEVFAVLDEQ
jgi:Uma2 family endonuclease